MKKSKFDSLYPYEHLKKEFIYRDCSCRISITRNYLFDCYRFTSPWESVVYETPQRYNRFRYFDESESDFTRVEARHELSLWIDEVLIQKFPFSDWENDVVKHTESFEQKAKATIDSYISWSDGKRGVTIKTWLDFLKEQEKASTSEKLRGKGYN